MRSSWVVGNKLNVIPWLDHGIHVPALMAGTNPILLTLLFPSNTLLPVANGPSNETFS